jgi:GDP-L-fucose synthase
MNKTDKIYIAGHTGLIGSAVVRRLQRRGFSNLLFANHTELELTDARAVDAFFDAHAPEYVVIAAGRVGGIVENQLYPADFMIENLAIQLNILKAAHRTSVRKLILFASSCMYPRQCPQPMPESALLSGHPEPTSLAYAISKLAGLQMCLAYNQQYGEQRFIPVIPNSTFGTNDNFDPKSGHVLSSLIRRFHEAVQTGAATITLWGSGSPRREFIQADDVADACILLLKSDADIPDLPINIGTGKDCSISELAKIIAAIVGYKGIIEWDRSKPDGAPRKLLDSSRIQSFGWKPEGNLEDGIKDTYQWYLDKVLCQEGSL